MGSADAKRRPRRRGGAADPQRIELQRARGLVTAAEAVRKFPFAGFSGAPAVSRELADHLGGVEACQLAAFDQTLAVAADRASAAFQAQEGWLDRVRAGLLALLEFFDEQPALARFLLVRSAQAGPAVLTARSQALDRLARVLDDERAPARGYPPPLTAQALVNGALGVLHERLSGPDPGVLVQLIGPLMSFIVLPFLGPKAARHELRRPPASGAHAAALQVLEAPGGDMEGHRTVLALRALLAEPLLSNRELALRTGVRSDASMSRILARAARLGLVENAQRGQAAANAWRASASGAEFVAAITREAAEAASMAVDVPEEFGGRMQYRELAVLRAIVDQPCLYTSEVGLRAGIDDRAVLSKVLASLTERAVVASAREPRSKGTPTVWLPTDSGRRLDAVIGRDTPRPQRSVALELMWQSGGRLSDRAGSALRVVGAEPGLSNDAIALRIGVTDKNTMSAVLAALARRELLENIRSRGRHNVWRLTPAGEKLERILWNETPPAVQRRLALGLLRERGGHLNHRVVSVLRHIVKEPGHSNNEIALAVGIESKGNASHLLGRLARSALIENRRTRGRENEWHATAGGRQAMSAILKENPDAGL